MKLSIIVAIIVTILLISSALSPSPDYVGVVEYVIDGDTIIVDNIHIRLLDIDTPELGEPGGSEALYFMIDLVYDSEVSLFCDSWDKYDRWLCRVELNSIDIGRELVSHGLARVWVDYSSS